MREKIAESLKSAMKAQDKHRLPTLRLIQAAIHDRDIPVSYTHLTLPTNREV